MQVHYQEGSMGNQSGKLQSFFFFFFFENYSITTEKSKFYTLAENVFLLDYSQIFLAQTSVKTIINSYSFFALLFFSLFSKKKKKEGKRKNGYRFSGKLWSYSFLLSLQAAHAGEYLLPLISLYGLWEGALLISLLLIPP